ncbi:hypothetical protein ONS95_000065 [Cadophora gregata]|uniref:uncharacterized protein n=1 Tax=Cadophora gregata TaxID=51156 RepID=UPI0026DBAF8A|nr:uncharacterized protein ONS95_000065 [Cadophora gregata]KAK0128081.1 hypothetical protein ONS95_000065 [Cadophora gregata]
MPESFQIDPEQALDYLKTKRKATCTYCKSRIRRIADQGENDNSSGMFSVCGHLFCTDCTPRFEAAVRQRSDAGTCSLCSRPISENLFARSETICVRREKESSVSEHDSSGISSKISELLRNIKSSKIEGKCIIFSSWTRSLDLVGRYLAHEKLEFLRIDGTFTLSERQNILNEFESNEELRILLMTTGTGAVGYVIELHVSSIKF